MAMITMSHPDIAGTATATQEAFDDVWEPLDWVIVAPDTVASNLPAPMHFAGDWSSSRNYEPGDQVEASGLSYVALQSSRNKAPASQPTYWEPVGGSAGGGTDNPAFTGAATFAGTVDVAGHLMAGADATLDPPLFGQATKYVVNADETITGNTINNGVFARITLDPAANINKSSTGVRGAVVVPNTNTRDLGNGISGTSFTVDIRGSGHAAALYGAAGTVYVQDTRTAGEVYGLYSTVDLTGSGDVGTVWGALSVFEVDSTSHVTGDVYIYAAIHLMYGAGTVNRIYAYYEHAPSLSGTINEKYGLWLPDYAGISPLSYYSWFDSRGVLRVREDDAVDPGHPQAVQALYNPRFAKYTPGAANHERIILGQWRDNVAEVGTEHGGTGVARSVALITGGTQKVLVDAAGDMEVLTAAKALIQKSPETAARRRLVLHDDGTVTCAAA